MTKKGGSLRAALERVKKVGCRGDHWSSADFIMQNLSP